ncbi:hypothetical protein EDD11_003567 [Mortierella claussenii]|nr:hypothetical protein EDD11_003567 [Mortierella claussenii]
MTITIIRQAPSASETRVRYTQENVDLHVTPVSTLIQNPGTLYIADECLSFFSAVSNTGFVIPYPSIIIHAIARESRVGPSIYCQLEGSLASAEPSNGHVANGDHAFADDDEVDEETVLELSFAPEDVSSLDAIYENLSYCASLHQDEDAEGYNMDEDDYYEDDENDHEGLYADADIQGGYIPKSSSATAIGVAPLTTEGSSSSATASTEVVGLSEMEPVPAIDLQSGEWYTGDPESDAKFELSEQGQVIVHQWYQNETQQAQPDQIHENQSGKRTRKADEQDQDQDMDIEAIGERSKDVTEEELQEARSKMMENLIQDPQGLVPRVDNGDAFEDANEDNA